jgi:hypothetical protein
MAGRPFIHSATDSLRLAGQLRFPKGLGTGSLGTLMGTQGEIMGAVPLQAKATAMGRIRFEGFNGIGKVCKAS